MKKNKLINHNKEFSEKMVLRVKNKRQIYASRIKIE